MNNTYEQMQRARVPRPAERMMAIIVCMYIKDIYTMKNYEMTAN
jgi:hypothetical protein